MSYTKDAKLTIRIKSETKEKLEALAHTKEVSTAELVRELINNYISKEENN